MSSKVATPPGWSSSTIGSICNFSRGVSWKKSQERRFPTAGGVPVLRIPNVQKTLELTELMYIDGLTETQRAKARVKRGWTLLVGSNGNPRRVGNCVYVAEPRDFLFASFLIGARSTDRERVDNEFLYRLLSSRPIQNDVWQSVQGSTGLSNIDLNVLKSLRVLIPPVFEQRKIAAILSSVDDAIEKTRAVIDQVQVVKRGLMQELLTRGLPGRHTRFKQTEIGEIPAEWDCLSLVDLADPRNGIQTGPFGSQLHASEYVEVGVPVIMPKDMMNGHISDAHSARIAEHKVEELSRHRVQTGDILFARRGDIGRAGLVTTGEEGWMCGTGCFRFRPKKPSVSRFLRHWIEWQPAVRWLNEHAVGQTMLNLNTSILGHLPVALPSENERSGICNVLEALAEQIEVLEYERVGLDTVKHSLMSVLLTGELRVTPDS